MSGDREANLIGKTTDKKVADITVSEMKEMFREVILETIDPDYGLELRDEVIEVLQKSFEQKAKGEGISLEEARKKLGVK